MKQESEERRKTILDSLIGRREYDRVVLTPSLFMCEETEEFQDDKQSVKVGDVLRQIAAYPFTEETELQYLEDLEKLAQIRREEERVRRSQRWITGREIDGDGSELDSGDSSEEERSG